MPWLQRRSQLKACHLKCRKFMSHDDSKFGNAAHLNMIDNFLPKLLDRAFDTGAPENTLLEWLTDMVKATALPGTLTHELEVHYR